MHLKGSMISSGPAQNSIPAPQPLSVYQPPTPRLTGASQVGLKQRDQPDSWRRRRKTNFPSDSMKVGKGHLLSKHVLVCDSSSSSQRAWILAGGRGGKRTELLCKNQTRSGPSPGSVFKPNLCDSGHISQALWLLCFSHL